MPTTPCPDVSGGLLDSGAAASPSLPGPPSRYAAVTIVLIVAVTPGATSTTTM
jgi:hypothetical protein